MDEEEYREIRDIARRDRMSLAEWVRQALRRARSNHPASVDAKLRAISKAARCSYPTADIEDMLREIDAGRGLS